LTQGLVVENGRLAGIKVAETKVEGRKAIPVPGSEHELRAPMVISSIGSVPEVIPGVAMKGEYYEFTGEDTPQYKGNERVFGVGNVVTGQGNIRVSLVHSQQVTERLIEDYLGIGDREDGARDISAFSAAAESRGAAQAMAVQDKVRTLPALSEAQIAGIDRRIQEQHRRAGYESDYDSWIRKVTPPDLE
jgi:hypothetical protein